MSAGTRREQHVSFSCASACAYLISVNQIFKKHFCPKVVTRVSLLHAQEEKKPYTLGYLCPCSTGSTYHRVYLM